MTVNIGNIQQRVTKIGGRKHYPWLDLIRFIAAFAVWPDITEEHSCLNIQTYLRNKGTSLSSCFTQ